MEETAKLTYPSAFALLGTKSANLSFQLQRPSRVALGPEAPLVLGLSSALLIAPKLKRTR